MILDDIDEIVKLKNQELVPRSLLDEAKKVKRSILADDQIVVDESFTERLRNVVRSLMCYGEENI